MHLGLRDGPFVLHNLISWYLNALWFFFPLKNPSKWTPSRFPNRAPVERDTYLQGICISLRNLIKIPLNKKALRKKHPFMFPSRGGPLEAHTHFWALLNISFGVPSKGAHLHSSFKVQTIWTPPSSFQVTLGSKGAPTEREKPVPGITIGNVCVIPGLGNHDICNFI